MVACVQCVTRKLLISQAHKLQDLPVNMTALGIDKTVILTDFHIICKVSKYCI